MTFSLVSSLQKTICYELHESHGRKVSIVDYVHRLKRQFSRAIFASSQLAPFGVILSVCLFFDSQYWAAGIVLAAVTLSVILFYIFISTIVKKNSPKATTKSVKKITLCDSEVWPVLMTNIFLTTLATNLLFIHQESVVITTALFGAIVLFFLYSALVIPFNCHPCFLIRGYHFYKVQFGNSKEECLLITKSLITNPELPIRAVRLADYVFIGENSK